MLTPKDAKRSTTFTFNAAADAFDHSALDFRLSINQAENLLSAAESYVDFIKFGFGTAFFTGGFERKLALYRANGIPVFFRWNDF